jgi:CRISPR-associated protein Cas2
MRTQRFVVAYDIREDDDRARVAALLSRIGVRVQKSVFDVELADEQVAELIAQLQNKVDLITDRVQAFRHCEACSDASFHLGRVVETMDARWWVL